MTQVSITSNGSAPLDIASTNGSSGVRQKTEAQKASRQMVIPERRMAPQTLVLNEASGDACELFESESACSRCCGCAIADERVAGGDNAEHDEQTQKAPSLRSSTDVSSALQPQSGGRAQSAGVKPIPAVVPPQKSAMQAETIVKKWRTPRGRRCSVLPDRLSIVSTTLESSPALRVSAAQAKVVDLAATNYWDKCVSNTHRDAIVATVHFDVLQSCARDGRSP